MPFEQSRLAALTVAPIATERTERTPLLSMNKVISMVANELDMIQRIQAFQFHLIIFRCFYTHLNKGSDGRSVCLSVRQGNDNG